MSFPTPLSAFGFSEGTGDTAQSEVGGYSLTAANPLTAWTAGPTGSGTAAGSKFSGIIGTNLSTWTLQFDFFINSFSGWSSILEIAADSIYFEFDGSGNSDAFLSGSDGQVNGPLLTTGGWHNFAITHSDSLQRTLLYHNGTLFATKNHASTIGSTDFSATAEVCGSVAQPMDGKVDNLRLWNSVLSQAEVAEAMNTPIGNGGSLLIWDGVSWFRSQPRIWTGSSWHTATQQLLSAPSAPSSGSFPRLAGMLIGNPHNYDEAPYQQQIAQLDLAILGMYNTWSSGASMTAAQAVSAIKGYNPNILLGNYTIMTETIKNGTVDPATQYKRDKLNSEVGPNGIGDWWAYNAAGNHTDWSGGVYNIWDVNVSLLTTPDSNGDRWPQWTAKQDNTRIMNGAGFDIWYSDNNFWQPRSTYDAARDGVNDDPNNFAVQELLRNGQRAYYDTAKALQPGMILMGNIDNDLDGSTYPSAASPFTQYKDVFGGAFIEHAMGESWSVETWGGWATMMGWYRKAMSNLTAPKHMIVDASMNSDPTDYKFLRYAFASVLMDDGHFSASTDYNEVLWYDEFDLAGTADTKWLGVALDPPQTSAWQNGVYRRRFANGMVLVNPKGNGSKTVNVGTGYHRFSGTQDPITNNGAAASSVTLADRDALFLVKD